MSFHDLPVEIWRQILAHLSVREKVHMVVADEYFWGAVDSAEIERAKDRLFCQGCHVAPAHGLYEDHRCVDCYDGDTNITLSRAFNVFGLKSTLLAKLPSPNNTSARFGQVDLTSVFKFRDVRDAARKKFRKPMADVYREREAARQRKQVEQAAAEAERTETMRAELAQRGVQFNDQIAHDARGYIKYGTGYLATVSDLEDRANSERMSAPRAATINARLDALGIDRSYYPEMREKYAKSFVGHRDLDRVVRIIAATSALEGSSADRKYKLNRALDLRGLARPTDNMLCKQYLEGKSGHSLTSTVEHVFELHLLNEHTRYRESCNAARDILLEYRGGIGDSGSYYFEDLKALCLKDLAAQDDPLSESDSESDEQEPACRCGLSTEPDWSITAFYLVRDWERDGPPRWMQDG